MDLLVTVIYYGMFAFLAITVLMLLYGKLKPLIDSILPKKPIGEREVKCPNCFAILRHTKKGFECDSCGFTDEFLGEQNEH